MGKAGLTEVNLIVDHAGQNNFAGHVQDSVGADMGQA
jgi:hypothetical protein